MSTFRACFFACLGLSSIAFAAPAVSNRKVTATLFAPRSTSGAYSMHLSLTNPSNEDLRVRVRVVSSGTQVFLRPLASGDPVTSQFTYGKEISPSKSSSAVVDENSADGLILKNTTHNYSLTVDAVNGSTPSNGGGAVEITVIGNAGYLVGDVYCEGSSTKHTIPLNGGRPF